MKPMELANVLSAAQQLGEDTHAVVLLEMKKGGGFFVASAGDDVSQMGLHFILGETISHRVQRGMKRPAIQAPPTEAATEDRAPETEAQSESPPA